MKSSSDKIGKQVLQRLKNGDEGAFDTVFWSYNSHVFHFIDSLLYDKTLAEDFTQNVFLKIWERRESINPEDSFESYLFTIARNMVYKESEKRLLSERFLEYIGNQQDFDGQLEAKIDAESLREYVDELVEQMPPSRRNIYYLSRKQHLTNKEIAKQLSISEKTVETQLYRALQYLRVKLADEITVLALLFISSEM
ncbi:RNA polymerase sigma-70 factor [Oscillospiraceae bacterium N12]|mgnify:CR=1 FL=1|jgi:RNA polymerase sigma-70 factor (family 1)|uniref:RNA polymerase sigma-70 factor n=1 Tax=Jilunia laotingensis TaxID=2763675 RepID=A0A926F3G7_9BACT|nr:RNA polymerase sigma-70 factor [Jilunia laotingensis]MBC8592292.1 RNA polymerase sigma-70 factor [Jilunia laotingensis]